MKFEFASKVSVTGSAGNRRRVLLPLLVLTVSTLAWALSGASARAAADDTSNPPAFRVDPSWPQPLPDKWLTGEVGGTCIDAQDHVFLINRTNLTSDEQRIAVPSPPVIELDADGAVVNSWGNPKNMPQNLHACYIDSEQNVWIAGSQDAMVQKYSHDGGKLLLQIGTKGRFDTKDGSRAGAAFNSSHTRLNGPASVAVDPANGEIYVADGYGNRRVAVFDRQGRFLRQWGHQATAAEARDAAGGAFLGSVHCVVLGNDGLVYVCDRLGDRVQVFDKMGKFRRNIPIKAGTGALTGIGSSWWVAFSPDSAQKFMYVADGGNEAIWIFHHGAAGERLATSFGRPGHQAGEFTFLHTISVDSKGNLIAGETINGRRVQVFRFMSKANDMRVGTGSAGAK